MSNHDKIDELVELGAKVWKDMIEDIISGYTQIIVKVLEEYKNDRPDETNRGEGQPLQSGTSGSRITGG